MGNILIVEDEEKVLTVIEAYLRKENYNVWTATNGTDALDIFNRVKFDLVLLDLMLPDIDGEEICKKIRSTSDVYIFMITAKGELADKIEGLNIGADEYLVKPFSPRELTARVNALFRRINRDNTECLSLDEGKLKIDKDRREVMLKNEIVNLTRNEFDILYTLASNKGKVFTREMLIESAFGSDFDGFDRTIDVHIKNIRKKIEEDSRNPKYIITITRVGYKFGGDS